MLSLSIARSSSARAAMRSSLKARSVPAMRSAEETGQLRHRHLLLRSRGEILHLCHPPRQLRIAQDHHGPRAGAVGALHPPLEVAAIADLGTDAGAAKRLQHL